MTCYTDNPMDKALASASPVYTMAHDGTLPVLPTDGRGYLLARNTLFVIGRGCGFTALIPVESLSTPTPFGAAEAGVYFDHAPPPRNLVRAAANKAVATSPTEWAGAIVGNDHGEYELQSVGVSSASPGHVTYGRSTYDDAALVLDMHSHGAGDPYFSDDDDYSDAEGVHIAVVFGRCAEHASLALKARVSIHGVFMPLDDLNEWTQDTENAA